MAQAVHFWDRIASGAVTTSDTHATIQTITAAELATAGFATNDDVLIVWFFRVGSEAWNQGAFHSILYDSTELMWDASQGHMVRPTDTGIRRTYMFMERVNLGGTIGDIVTRHRTSGAGINAITSHSEVLVIRLADFGAENTDWFWNRSTTTVLNTTTYSATSRAAVTWTPDSVEDWVYLAQATTDMPWPNVAVNTEGRVALDGVLDSGDWSFQPAWDEKLSLVWFSRLASLSAAAHTLAVETRDDTVSATSHRNSRLLVFRKAVWPDLFADLPGSVNVSASSAETQVATVTDTLSGEQPLVIFGNGYIDVGTSPANGFLWVRENGTTVIEPAANVVTNSYAGRAYDATDEVPLHWFGYKSAASGALDLDLFAAQSLASIQPLLGTKFLVWGMEVAASVGGGSPGRDLMLMGVG